MQALWLETQLQSTTECQASCAKCCLSLAKAFPLYTSQGCTDDLTAAAQQYREGDDVTDMQYAGGLFGCALQDFLW